MMETVHSSNKKIKLGFQFLTLVAIKNAIFWDIAVICSFETSVHWATKCYISGDRTLPSTLSQVMTEACGKTEVHAEDRF